MKKKKQNKDFTHKQLVEMGERWLIYKQRCKVVVKEITIGCAPEIPDVLGWRYNGPSILIECKTSLIDFYKDAKKPSRTNPDKSLGVTKYYLCPKDLITENMLPEGWGLLYATGRGITMIKKGTKKVSKAEKIAKNELPYLIALVQRAQIRGFDVNCRAKELE